MRKKICDGIPQITSAVAALVRTDNSSFSGDEFEDIDRKFEDLRISTDSEIQSFPTSSIAETNFPPAAGSQFLTVHAHLASDAGEIAAEAVADARTASGAALKAAAASNHDIDSKKAHMADDAYTQAQSQLDDLGKESSAPAVVTKVATILSTVDGALGTAQGTSSSNINNPVTTADEALPSAAPASSPVRPDNAPAMTTGADPAVSTAANQEQAVRTFYEAINSKHFDEAYSGLSSSYRAGTNRQQFEAGYATTVSVTTVYVHARSDGSNNVDVVLQAQDFKGGATINTRYEGFWNVVLGPNGWLLDDGQFTKTAQD
jgi:hypothetical protein